MHIFIYISVLYNQKKFRKLFIDIYIVHLCIYLLNLGYCLCKIHIYIIIAVFYQKFLNINILLSYLLLIKQSKVFN